MRKAKKVRSSKIEDRSQKSKSSNFKLQASNYTADLLFEIGTEELPAAYLPGLIEQLGVEAKALLVANHLTFKQVESFGTPRRLVVLVRGLSGVQRKPSEEIRGPSKQAAFDAAGKPTQALLGFLRSRGGTLDHVNVVRSPKGEHVALKTLPTETPTTKILPTFVPELIGKLRAPKTMRWDDSNVRFARPIRWLLALYGSIPIRCAIGSLKSRPQTWVGGPLRPKSKTVSSSTAYLGLMERAGIILDHEKRRTHIAQEIKRLATKAGGALPQEVFNHGLLDEVTFLVEKPWVLAGSFDAKYLNLPREVLLASMGKHQRVFAVEDPSDKKPLSRWIAVLEEKPKKPAAVQVVIERILNARLADSLSFWNEDRQKLPLERLVADLSSVTFHEKLGSMADKTRRLEALAETLIKIWKVDEAQANKIRRAATLAKADLVTHLVREFPTLQGVIGKHYALESVDGKKEDEDVALALEQQYFLQEATDKERRLNAAKIPGGWTSFALTIIEKYDTLTGYFGIGIEPTGNADPFGLRPRAQGIVEVAGMIGSKYPLLLSRLFHARAAFAPFQAMSEVEKDRIASRVHGYIRERLYTLNPLWSRDVIDAVLTSPSCDDLTDVMTRIEALAQLCGATQVRDQLLQAGKVVERTRNILKNAQLQQAEVSIALLNESSEKELWVRYQNKKQAIENLISKGGREEPVRADSYIKATVEYGQTFYEPLHEFFDKVMVNVPDEALRQNRLALMKAINVLYTERIADLSKLTLLQQPEPSHDAVQKA